MLDNVMRKASEIENTPRNKRNKEILCRQYDMMGSQKVSKQKYYFKMIPKLDNDISRTRKQMSATSSFRAEKKRNCSSGFEVFKTGRYYTNKI